MKRESLFKFMKAEIIKDKGFIYFYVIALVLIIVLTAFNTLFKWF